VGALPTQQPFKQPTLEQPNNEAHNQSIKQRNNQTIKQPTNQTSNNIFPSRDNLLRDLDEPQLKNLL